MQFIQHLGGTFPSTIAVPGSEPSPEEMKGEKGKSKKKSICLKIIRLLEEGFAVGSWATKEAWALCGAQIMS